MNKNGKENITLDDALEKWSSLSETEKEDRLSDYKPFVKNWINKSRGTRIAVEYAVLLVFLLLAVLVMSAESMYIRVLSLPIFFFIWGMFINIEKCSKKGADLLEGIIAINACSRREE